MDSIKMEILDQVIVFDLSGISLWSGRRRLKVEDLKLVSNDEIPPEKLASLGSKKIIDPEAIRDFETLKKEAHRVCAKVGIRFLGGYAVPKADADDVASKLDDIEARFYARKKTFLADYDTHLSAWVQADPNWSKMVSEAALDRKEVDQRIHFGWTPVRVAEAAPDQSGSVLNAKLKREVMGLADQLYYETARMASEVIERSLLGKTRVTSRVLHSVGNIRGKLAGLKFLDKRVGPIIATIDHIVAQMAGEGWIEGIQFTALYGLFQMLANEDVLKQHGQKILDGASVEDATAATLPGPAAVAVASQVQPAVQPPPQVQAATQPAPVAQTGTATAAPFSLGGLFDDPIMPPPTAQAQATPPVSAAQAAPEPAVPLAPVAVTPVPVVQRAAVVVEKPAARPIPAAASAIPVSPRTPRIVRTPATNAA